MTDAQFQDWVRFTDEYGVFTGDSLRALAPGLLKFTRNNAADILNTRDQFDWVRLESFSEILLKTSNKLHRQKVVAEAEQFRMLSELMAAYASVMRNPDAYP